MYVLVTYDVETMTSDGQRRLRQVARQCLNYGQRVQNSVFECSVSPAQFTELRLKLSDIQFESNGFFCQLQFTELRLKLSDIIDHKKDSIRFYFLGNNYSKRVEYIGVVTSYNVEDELII